MLSGELLFKVLDLT